MIKKIQVLMNAKEVGQTIMKIQNKQKNREKNNGDPWNKEIHKIDAWNGIKK